MDKLQAEAISAMELMRADSAEEVNISIPLQTLFDECLNFISVADFNV